MVTSKFALNHIHQNSPADFQELVDFSVEEYQQLQDQLHNASDRETRVSADNSLRFINAFRIPEVVFHGPNIGVTGQISIRGTKRTVELIIEENCHTPGDLVVYFPEEKILFCGDLLFSHRFPYIGAGNPINLN